MAGAAYIALAALILLLLPMVVMPLEGRRVPLWMHGGLAAGGITMAGLRGGLEAAAWSLTATVVALVAVAAIITALHMKLNFHVFTSGHIRLLAAGSAWVGLGGAIVVLSLSLATLFGFAAIQRGRVRRSRPDFAMIAALAILVVMIGQVLPAGALQG